jgi:hypothetical protein
MSLGASEIHVLNCGSDYFVSALNQCVQSWTSMVVIFPRLKPQFDCHSFIVTALTQLLGRSVDSYR